MEIKEEIF